MKKVNTQRLSDMLDELEKANANNESITVALMGSIAANLASIADSLETITEERYETKRS